ncbi:MAG: hypothetical protein V2A54_04995 [Bacteroidota bacterium]
MSELVFSQVLQIQQDVEREQIGFSHLADDLIDHLCCMIEAEMQSGLSFEKAYEKVKKSIEPQGLKKIEEKTLLLIDKKYRIMKTTMKVFAMISLPIIAFGGLFKIMHWPGAGPMLLVGFALLGLVFYPSSIFVLKREAKIKGGDFIYITALIGGIILIFGVLFKLMHWPFAGPMLLIGFAIIIAVLIPSILISKISSAQNSKLKFVYSLGALFLILILGGLCCKFFHWPGAGPLLLVGSICLTLVWLPLYAFFTYKVSNYVKGSFIFICVALIFFNLFNMLLAMNVSKDVMNDYLQSGVTYNKGFKAFGKYNEAFVQKISADSTIKTEIKNKINEILISSEALCLSIDNIKIDLICQVDGIDKTEAAKIIENSALLRNKTNYDIPTFLLLGDVNNENIDKTKPAYLLEKNIVEFKTKLIDAVSKDPLQTEFIESILSTSLPKTVIPEEKLDWAMINFYHTPSLAVLNTLSRLQFNTRLAENSVIKFLASQESEKSKNLK